MCFRKKLAFSLLSVLGMSCAEEKNPYKTRYETSGPSSTATSSAPSSSGNSLPADTTATNAPTPAQDTTTAAKPDAIPKASLAGVQLICSNPPALAKFQAELAVICTNGQPTAAFASALAAPYKGGATPPLVILKSTDVNSVSEFIVLAVIEVAKPIADTFAKRASLTAGTLTVGNASLIQTNVATTAATGGANLGGSDVKFDLTVKAGIITVNNISILQLDSVALNTEKSVIATLSALKVGAPDNTDDMLSNSLSFMMQDGTGTKVISVNHQIAANKGQGATAEKTVLDLGRAAMTDAYTKLSQ